MHQIHQAGSALLLGLIAGLYYDLLKTIRRHGGGTMLFDLLFWLAVAITLFIQTMTMGQGRVRIFMLVVNAIGALLYFLMLSKPVLEILSKVLDKVLQFAKVIMSPIRKTWAKGRKVAKRSKEGFQNRVKRHIIETDFIRKRNLSAKADKAGGEQVAQKGRHIYQVGGIGADTLRGVQSGQSSRADRNSKSRTRRTRADRGGADGAKRRTRT